MSKNKKNKDEDIDLMNELVAEYQLDLAEEIQEFIDKYINKYDDYQDEEEYIENTNSVYYTKNNLKDNELPKEEEYDDYFKEIYIYEKLKREAIYEDTDKLRIFFQFESDNYKDIYMLEKENKITKKRIKKINNN